MEMNLSLTAQASSRLLYRILIYAPSFPFRKKKTPKWRRPVTSDAAKYINKLTAVIGSHSFIVAALQSVQNVRHIRLNRTVAKQE